ncbi:HAD-IA family hydrolase [Thalassotalea atypica]|uniref:HAD-IA family hydrolase n=1 Tax=Thalassotalea atypica TaxID=2054316 RepID=UPI002572F46B|nr:HAD-IA family hydrolase [Thalassotalea atypica]
MRFYRRLTSFQAISFDLDDTLYANRDVMVATEKSMVAYFERVLASYNHEQQVFDRCFWWAFRAQAIKTEPSLAHEITDVRRQTYRLGILSLTGDQELSVSLAEQALAHFIEKRSDFKVPDSVHALLARLAMRYPLIAISNGNVDAKAIGIEKYFCHMLHAGNGKLTKPNVDMFTRAANQLGLPLSQILHVGDCGHADVFGALRSGMQSVWLSCYDVGKPLRVVPHVEITDIAQLERLV